METSYLSIKPNQTISSNMSAISFTNPDGSKVEIGLNDSKNVRIESKNGVLWVSNIE